MSELLLRGWNVAVPVVDVGDDAFVIDDDKKTTQRVQVKTSTAKASEVGRLKGTFNLSRKQLRTARPIELFYVLMVRAEPRWRVLVIPRAELVVIRSEHVDGATSRPGQARKPLGDEKVETDSLRLDIEINGDVATGWGAALSQYLDRWPEASKVLHDGPPRVGEGDEPDLRSWSEGGLGRSRSLEKGRRRLAAVALPTDPSAA